MSRTAAPSPQAGSLALAFALMATAGFTDATGVLAFDLYPSFMSGNATNLAVSVAHGERPRAMVLGAVALIFVAGAFLGRLVRLRTRRRAAVLLVEAGLLALAGAAWLLGVGFGALACSTLAMGLQNAALSHAGGLSVGTYVTGALARLGSSLAEALAGGPRWAWVGELGLWGALVAGAVVGAAAFGVWGLPALFLTAVAALGLAAVAAGEPLDPPAEPSIR